MIESSKKTGESRVVTPVEKPIDKANIGNILRPLKLEDYVGQENIKKHLSVSIASSKIRWEALDHILFYGPPGLGKTTLSQIIATEMETNLKSTSGPAIEKQSDYFQILRYLKVLLFLFLNLLNWIDDTPLIEYEYQSFANIHYEISLYPLFEK
jgi:Holliday junction DNA helicase RuvB